MMQSVVSTVTVTAGAFMSASTGPKDSPENTHFSDEELTACVQEARRRQVRFQAVPSCKQCIKDFLFYLRGCAAFFVLLSLLTSQEL
jgi:hypothetical protein